MSIVVILAILQLAYATYNTNNRIIATINFDGQLMTPKYIANIIVTYHNDPMSLKISKTLYTPFKICEQGYYLNGHGYGEYATLREQLYDGLCDEVWNEHTDMITRNCQFVCEAHINRFKVNYYIRDYLRYHSFENNTNRGISDIDIDSTTGFDIYQINGTTVPIYQQFIVTIDYDKNVTDPNVNAITPLPLTVNITRIHNGVGRIGVYATIYTNLLNGYIMCQSDINEVCHEHDCIIEKDETYNWMRKCTTLCYMIC